MFHTIKVELMMDTELTAQVLFQCAGNSLPQVLLHQHYHLLHQPLEEMLYNQEMLSSALELTLFYSLDGVIVLTMLLWNKLTPQLEQLKELLLTHIGTTKDVIIQFVQTTSVDRIKHIFINKY
jgi:hypothetical protein